MSPAAAPTDRATTLAEAGSAARDRDTYGPGRLELARRAAVLAVLIVRAAILYARTWLVSRGIGADTEALSRRYVDFAKRFVAIATKHRGALIKLGQVASLRVDVLPEEFSLELARLQDRVPPHPFEEIEAQIAGELGAEWRSHFQSLDSEPIAAASLGQVHHGFLRDGREVAVKVLYPGVERSVAVDVRMAGIAMWLFDFLVVPDLVSVHDQLRESIVGEMDYLAEGRAAEGIAANLALDPDLAAHVRVPGIVWETTSRRVLTMEYIDGDKVNDLDALRARGVDVDDIVAWACRSFLHMMLRDGFFHCDPHPGNLMVDRDGQLVVIDFGMNQRISNELLTSMRDNVVATVARDADGYARSLVEMGAISERDVPAVKELAKMNFDPTLYNLTPAEMAQIDFFQHFKEVRQHLKHIETFRLPDGIVMWGRAISLLYGLVSELAPGIRPLDVVGPYVFDFLSGKGGAGGAPVSAGSAEAASAS